MILFIKIVATLFLAGVVFGGALKASPGGRDPSRRASAEYLAGAVSFIGGILLLVYLWW